MKPLPAAPTPHLGEAWLVGSVREQGFWLLVDFELSRNNVKMW